MDARAGGVTPATPRVGEVIRRLRTQRGLSVRGLAEQAGISASFLGAVERGESDIASLLGYSLRQSTPR
jgi:transcriptional regulator with XRE-family HTH domain